MKVIIFAVILFVVAPTVAYSQKTKETAPVRPLADPGLMGRTNLNIGVKCSGSTDQTFFIPRRDSVFSGDTIKWTDGKLFVLDVTLSGEKWVQKDPVRSVDKELIMKLVSQLKPVQILDQPYQLQIIFPPFSAGQEVPGPEAVASVLAEFTPGNNLVLKKTGCSGLAVTSK